MSRFKVGDIVTYRGDSLRYKVTNVHSDGLYDVRLIYENGNYSAIQRNAALLGYTVVEPAYTCISKAEYLLELGI